MIPNHAETANSSAILPGAPWLIAHREMLGINKPYKFSLNHQDYVLWQSEEGEIFGLNNICPHLQAPLSDGWICQKRKTIACPFHALEFNGQGKLEREGKVEGQALAQPLDLIVEGDLIWTYGIESPKLPVPNLIPRRTEGYQFLGVAGETSIQAEFLKCLKINYDFNHVVGTHREPFKFEQVKINHYQKNGVQITVEQEIVRSHNSWREIMKNPALLTAPKTLYSHFEYAFPSTASLITETELGQLAQFFLIYPESQQSTKIFALLYIKPKNRFNQLWSSMLKRHLLKSFDWVVEQDKQAVESLYPEQKPKIRLPREEIMLDAEKLYRTWQ